VNLLYRRNIQRLHGGVAAFHLSHHLHRSPAVSPLSLARVRKKEGENVFLI
jgi:hypothetical protein